MESIIKDYPLLRVFDCEEFPINGKLPKKVGEWIHLRYLGLAGTQISELPSSIQKLRWLQTLDLRVAVSQLSVPNILWKMKQLRHLYFPKNQNSPSTRYYLVKGGGLLRLDGLSNLQTILNLDLDILNQNGVSTWRSLKTLSAACETNKKALDAILACTNMKSFRLFLYFKILNEEPMMLSRCDVLHYLDLYGVRNFSLGLNTPLCLDMLPKSLVCLRIFHMWLHADPLPVLEQLPKLVRLSLHLCYGGDRMACSARGFPELIDLCLDGLFSLCHWEVEQGALPKLKNLLIMNIRLTKSPDAIPRSVNVDIS